MEDRKNGTPEILSAKDLQDMGFSRSMSYALFNREDTALRTRIKKCRLTRFCPIREYRGNMPFAYGRYR